MREWLKRPVSKTGMPKGIGSSNLPPSASWAILVSMEKIKIEQETGAGLAWIAGWLFTIGFAGLTFWQGVLAVVIWPYHLGVLFAG